MRGSISSTKIFESYELLITPVPGVPTESRWLSSVTMPCCGTPGMRGFFLRPNMRADPSRGSRPPPPRSRCRTAPFRLELRVSALAYRGRHAVNDDPAARPRRGQSARDDDD